MSGCGRCDLLFGDPNGLASMRLDSFAFLSSSRSSLDKCSMACTGMVDLDKSSSTTLEK
jgi:hypothetical protein